MPSSASSSAPHSNLLIEKIQVALIFGFFCALAYYGWRLFWFLTDDAYIAFRYVRNSTLGYGYVWNPPPFLPVEGYTSFLWVVLLDLFWRATGIQPPAAANALSLVFTWLSLLAGGLMALRLASRPPLRRCRTALLVLVLGGAVTNRTFLAWSSSGLETAMFNFFFLAWVYAGLFVPPDRRAWSLAISIAAALVYLTRPDGLLVAFSTAGLIALNGIRRRAQPAAGVDLAAGALLVLIVAGHLLWRYHTYGEWLPNTYYAKVTRGLYLESGLRYLGSFIVEYSLWVWLGLLAILAGWKLRAFARAASSRRLSNPARVDFAGLLRAVLITTIVAHFLYYTAMIGGDHFEYRVYSHLIPLILVSFVSMLGRLKVHPGAAAGLLLLWVVLSWPVQWTHWYITRDLATRGETGFLKVSVAQAVARKLPWLPSPGLQYLSFYDQMQFWLIDHAVGMRHQEHKVFHQYMLDLFRTHSRATPCPVAGNSLVMAAQSVGVIGWLFPEVSIIDTLGLNDYVIARNADTSSAGLMAHERKAPAGYLECFSPGLTEPYRIVYVPTERIAACEAGFR
jgi:arabinofuranosyltransferase